MYVSPPNYSRVRRSTAGINRRYDEQDYVLVSFPNVNKHSVVPAASVNIDPLDKQNGSIKTFGSKKNLRIISSGSKEVMKERASRFAASAGSEEVELVPDEQENDENQDDDDDEYLLSSMHRTTKGIKKPIVISEQSKSDIEIVSPNINNQRTTTSNYECSESQSSFTKKPFGKRQINFDRVYSSKTGTKRSQKDISDESSLSESNGTDDERDENLPVIKKNNELHSLLKKPYRRRKKQAGEPVRNVDGPCVGCIKHEEEMMEIRKRLDRVEKVVPVVKRFRSKTPVVLTGQTGSNTNANDVYTSVEEATGVNPNEIKSTPSRPTMIMRELIKKAGHIADKLYLKEHEKLFQTFIQMKCMIHDDNMNNVWKEVKESLGRQHLDEENNKKKRIRQESPSIIEDTTPPMPSQTLITDNEQATTPLTSTTSELI